MEIDLIIDHITPCLIERSTAKILPTSYRKIDPKEIRLLTKGWRFNWVKPFKDGYEVFGLTVGDEIQGLISLKPSEDFVEVGLVESSPHNVGSKGVYYGVGAHLFAFAAKFSFDNGFDGYISFSAKTDLIEHYKNVLSAKQIGNTQKMYLDTTAASSLVDTYFKKEG